MKIQDSLPQYLYQQKKLSLPGLGHFELNPSINVYEQKEEGWPANTITFLADRNTVLTEDFLQYLVQQTGKMKPLAESDLESFISSGVQMINIGKPFPLKGIGSISKTTQGDLVFTQGTPALEKIDSINTDHVKDRTAEQDEINEIDFSHEPAKTSNKLIIGLASVLGLVLVAWAVYFSLSKKQDGPVEQQENKPADTVATVIPSTADTTTQVKTDTSTIQPADTTRTTTLPLSTVNTGSFQLVILSFKSKEAAQQKLDALKQRGHRVDMRMKDSTSYQIVLTVNRSLGDTTYVKDSLKKWYLWKSYLIK